MNQYYLEEKKEKMYQYYLDGHKRRLPDYRRNYHLTHKR